MTHAVTRATNKVEDGPPRKRASRDGGRWRGGPRGATLGAILSPAPTMNELLAAYRYTTNNHGQIEGSRLCGCCNCVEIFRPEDIVGWTGLTMDNMTDPKATSQQTAMCPRCGSEAVLGDGCGFPINAHFLARMNEAWFQRTMIRRPAAQP